MQEKYLPPLAIHLIWNFADSDNVDPILNAMRHSFARNIQRPFSRGLSLPLFFYSTNDPDQCPIDLPSPKAQADIVFVFTSGNTIGRDRWREYISLIPNTSSFHLIPIALDSYGLGHGEDEGLKNLNFIRSYDWSAAIREQKAILTIAHEVYRHGFVSQRENDFGRASSIKIFLSHAKAGDTGRILAESIKRYIDGTNMSQFFDATDISPGFKFDEEIIKHLKQSTVIAIGSDFYSSRYWCQREILCAKENDRPIVAVNCLDDFEDRVFPAAANVPCVHISPSESFSEREILRVLIAAIIETIRFFHAKSSLEYYKERGWIDASCEILARPPEIRKIISIKNRNIGKICYPEPPIYLEEADWLDHFGIKSYTPLWGSDDMNLLENHKIGISISDSNPKDYSQYHLHTDQLQRLSQDLVRHLLARSATVIYGGDLRNDGFTEFILNEAVALKSRLNNEKIHIENHLAFPLHNLNAAVIEWKAKYRSVIKTVLHEVPVDAVGLAIGNKDLDIDSTSNKYLWSRCLSEMRCNSISSSTARICAGGKLVGYKGKMPGVLEEILITLEADKPLYLLGGFGGIVSAVCNSIFNQSVEPPLTEEWQVSANAGYDELQRHAKSQSFHADYVVIKELIEHLSVKGLAARAGLTEIDYTSLMRSQLIDECVHLILQGLRNINK